VFEASASSRPAEFWLKKNALKTGMSSPRLTSGGSSTSNMCIGRGFLGDGYKSALHLRAGATEQRANL